MNVINTVITTNFDDLLNEACYTFSSEVRPIVCAHDSSIKSIRITSKRRKIIKIHGDFLFDNIKNTVRELESLEENTKEKIKQYATEFGMIFVGYSGNDRSVMDVINTLLLHDHYFPHGIYWCVRKDSTLSAKVEELQRFPKFHLVEIDGFDEFCASVNEALQLPMPPEMSSPFDALSKRLNNLCDQIKVSPSGGVLNPIIQKDLKKLADKVSEWTENSTEKTRAAKPQVSPEIRVIPLTFMIEVDLQNKRFEEAKKKLQLLTKSPDIKSAHLALRFAQETSDYSLIEKIAESFSANPALIKKNPGHSLDLFVSLSNAEKYELAEKFLDCGFAASKLQDAGPFNIQFYYINKAQLFLHQKKQLPENLELELENIVEKPLQPSSGIGAMIVLGKQTEAVKKLLSLSSPEIKGWLGWPITKLLKEEQRHELRKKSESE
jgi:hypothetical protein